MSDAKWLSNFVLCSANLTSLVLQSNLIDDDLIRILLIGLTKVSFAMTVPMWQKNSSITHLDLAHNKITYHGVRLLSNLIGRDGVLTSLSVADNQILSEVRARQPACVALCRVHAHSGECFAKALH